MNYKVGLKHKGANGTLTEEEPGEREGDETGGYVGARLRDHASQKEVQNNKSRWTAIGRLKVRAEETGEALLESDMSSMIRKDKWWT